MKILQRIVSVVVIIVIFYFLLSHLISNWQKIPFSDLKFDIGNLLLSFFLLFAYFLIFIVGWKNLVQGLGESIKLSKVFWIISTSQIAKYVPGGIWYTLGRVYLCKTEKMKSEIVFLSVILETCLLMLTNMVLFMVSVNFIRDVHVLNPFISIVIVVALLILLYPPLLNMLVNSVLNILKRPRIKLTIRYHQMLMFSIYFFGLWIAQIIGFYFLVNSVYCIEVSKIFHLSAAYTLAWITGFIVLFAPGGLGVREGMMTLLLSSIMPTPLAIVVSLIHRVWITVFEILTFFIGIIVRKVSSHKETKNHCSPT